MNIQQLIEHFSKWEIVPIDVQDDVVPVLKEHCKLDLYFWPSPNINTNIYKGYIVQFEPIDFGSEVLNQVSIEYAAHLPSSWQRVICCKELIHLLDPIDTRVSTQEALDKLIERIVLPSDMTAVSDGKSVWNDRFAVWQAIAILFPWASRELYKKGFREGKITINEIADEVDLPLEFAALVMNDVWEEIYHIISV